jgi:16S rRNA (uracil1498-N3)-methyltransferase
VEEQHHVRHVLRLKEGATLEALDGQGGAVPVRLSFDGKRAVIEAIGEVRLLSHAAAGIRPVTLLLAIPKGEAMLWIIEKCVELGVERMVPFFAVHSVVHLGNKSPQEFQERWQRVARESLKQCGRLWEMAVESPATSLGQAMQRLTSNQNVRRFFCDEVSVVQERIPHLAHVLAAPPEPTALLIGPEGGWRQSERDEALAAGWQQVNLGPLVLRVETAALFAVSLAGAIFACDSGAKSL